MPPLFFYRVLGFFGLFISGYYSILMFLIIILDLRDFGFDVFVSHMPNDIISYTVEALIYGTIALTVFLIIMYAMQKMKLFSHTSPFYRVIGFFGLLISGYYSIIVLFHITNNVYDFGFDAFVSQIPNQIISPTVELLIFGIISLTVFFVIMYTLQKKKLFSYTKCDKV